jgi:prolyl oligopeptidase
MLHATRGSAPGNELHALELGGGEPLLKTLAGSDEHVVTYLHNDGSRFLVRTTRDAPCGPIAAVDASAPAGGRWADVVPQGDDTLYLANVVAERLVAVFVRDARHVVEVYSLDGRREREVVLPDLGTTFSGYVGRPADRYAFYSFNSVAYPGAASVFRLDPRSGESAPVAAPRLPFDPRDFVTTQAFFRSKDGTRVPMFVAHRRGLERDGRRPVFLYAYGAFAWAATPWYQPHVLAWMERGGVYALANVRGGGEYGQEWYRAGIGARRQNAVDDYLAAAEHLVSAGYTSRGRIVANGGSASGALPPLAMVQRPELFGAAVIDIPVLDMLRFDRFTGGTRWRSELGDPSRAEDVPVLLAQSPYHLLRKGACYPPTLVTAGEKDQTAMPAHAYKFVAALQAAQSCAAPALLQVVWGGGHSFGLDPPQTAATLARQLVYLERALEPAAAAAVVEPGAP